MQDKIDKAYAFVDFNLQRKFYLEKEKNVCMRVRFKCEHFTLYDYFSFYPPLDYYSDRAFVKYAKKNLNELSKIKSTKIYGEYELLQGKNLFKKTFLTLEKDTFSTLLNRALLNLNKNSFVVKRFFKNYLNGVIEISPTQIMYLHTLSDRFYILENMKLYYISEKEALEYINKALDTRFDYNSEFLREHLERYACDNFFKIYSKYKTRALISLYQEDALFFYNDKEVYISETLSFYVRDKLILRKEVLMHNVTLKFYRLVSRLEKCDSLDFAFYLQDLKNALDSLKGSSLYY